MPTVSGTFKDISGSPLGNISIEIVPNSGLQIDDNGAVVVPVRKSVVTDSDGSFSVSLEHGDYTIDVANVDVQCVIPDQTGPVDLGDTDVITNTGDGQDPSY